MSVFSVLTAQISLGPATWNRPHSKIPLLLLHVVQARALDMKHLHAM